MNSIAAADDDGFMIGLRRAAAGDRDGRQAQSSPRRSDT
jgi:hypothetical protein